MFRGGREPQKLEGRVENSQPREFFWDSVTRYVVGVIIGLAAIDTITKFVRGSSISCLGPYGFSEEFLNNYCSSSIPRSEYFLAFIAVHAILILVPHSLWINRYNGNFEFFFTQSRELDRTRDSETGIYSDKNYIIIDQLEKTFTTYNQNWMYIFYILKLISQLIITLVGFLVAVFYFTNFNEVFLCPRSFLNTSIPTTDPLWPLDRQVTCVFNSIRLFAVIRFADLVLLMILILAYLWSVVWCTSSHSAVLGTDEVAKFSFQSSISPRYHLFDSPILRSCHDLMRKFLYGIFEYIPLCGAGPHINTNLDFLMLKLFRTDSGLGFVLREMQILLKIKDLNDNDQRIVNLHRFQQRLKDMNSGDIISTDDAGGIDRDIIWTFKKEAGQPGVFETTSTPLGIDKTLVIPPSLRGAILGFASLSPCQKYAMYITFGSTSLGIPSALARVFQRVYVLNFNPYFKKKNAEEKKYFSTKRYSSEIHSISYPEDILSSESEKSNDFGSAMTYIMEGDIIDFVVIGPVERKFYISTLSLSITKMTPIHFKKGTMLLTITPTKIGYKDTKKLAQFHSFIPSKKYFKERNQSIQLLRRNESPPWPPVAFSKDKDGSEMRQSPLKIPLGNTDSQVHFQLYERVKEPQKSSTKTENTSSATNGGKLSLLIPSSDKHVPTSKESASPAVVAGDQTERETSRGPPLHINLEDYHDD